MSWSAGVPGLAVGYIDWALTDAKRLRVERATRQKAVRDARRRRIHPPLARLSPAGPGSLGGVERRHGGRDRDPVPVQEPRGRAEAPLLRDEREQPDDEPRLSPAEDGEARQGGRDAEADGAVDGRRRVRRRQRVGVRRAGQGVHERAESGRRREAPVPSVRTRPGGDPERSRGDDPSARRVHGDGNQGRRPRIGTPRRRRRRSRRPTSAAATHTRTTATTCR